MVVPKKKSYKPKKKAKVKLRKVTPIPDKRNSYIVEHEVHDAPEPAPLHIPLPKEVLALDKVHEATKHPWVEWIKSLF